MNIPAPDSKSYLSFILREAANREYLFYAIVLCTIQFVVFKLCYPFPDFFNDSFWYIWAASHNVDISIWPIGYSKFLAAFHILTNSDTALVVFQYCLMQLATLHFYFTLLYFFKTNKWVRNILFLFLFINPLTSYLCNTVASDALFGALSLLWLTELIWILRKPRLHQFITQGVLLFFCFTIRNTAYYYPIVATLAFILSNQPVWRKLAGIAFPILLLIPFISHTKNAAYQLTGTRQFSLFTGWQLANNALYIYDRITVDSMQLPTAESRELNRIAIKFFQQPDFIKTKEYVDSFPGNFYIVVATSPLKQYFFSYQQSQKKRDMVKDVAKMSALFEPFGRSIIVHHPLAYIQYFALPNTRFYFLPPLSDLWQYNGGQTEVAPMIKAWFNYPGLSIYSVSNEFRKYLSAYKVLFLLLNIYFLSQVVLVMVKIRRIQFSKNDFSFYLLMVVYLLSNFLFSVSATINILRYQYIPMYILLATALLMSEALAAVLLVKK